MVDPSGRKSTTAQDGPSEAWLWKGHQYTADNCFAAAGSAAAGSPRFTSISSRSMALARTCRSSISLPGNVCDSLQVVLSVLAARTAAHSSLATTPRKFCIRTTRAPGMLPIDVSSTESSFAPNPGGRMARPCSIPGREKSWIKTFVPVHFFGTSGRRIGLPTTVYVMGSFKGAFESTFNSRRLPPTSAPMFVMSAFAPSFNSAWRAVAAACRNSVPPRGMPVLPPVPPWSGVSAVSPSTTVMRATGTPSSSATICVIAILKPVPTSTLLV